MRLYFLAILLSVFLVTNANADIIIDDYSSGAPLAQFFSGTATNTTIAAGIFGGSRDESITVRDLGGSEFFGTIGFNGNLAIGQGSQDQILGSLFYDDFSSFDMTGGGVNTRFALAFVSNDVDAALVDVFSLTATSGGTSVTQLLTVPASSSLPQNVYVDFSDFIGVDSTQLDSVQLAFDFQTTPGRDVEVNFFGASAVPEPSALILLGLGGSSLLLRRRRR